MTTLDRDTIAAIATPRGKGGIGIVLFFPAPASFTGENVVELQAHGGPVILDLPTCERLACL